MSHSGGRRCQEVLRALEFVQDSFGVYKQRPIRREAVVLLHLGVLGLSPQIAPLGWTPYRPLSDQSASGHIVSLRHPTAVVEEVQAALADQHRIITSARVGGIRVSLHVYNSEDDVRALSEALESIGRDKT